MPKGSIDQSINQNHVAWYTLLNKAQQCSTRWNF